MAFLKDLSKSKADLMIGGVCGGLGAHTFIPTWIWRAGFLAALLCFGTGGLVYIILWIALPEARTITEKMKMQGEPVTLSNIESSVKKGLNEKENALIQWKKSLKMGNESKILKQKIAEKKYIETKEN